MYKPKGRDRVLNDNEKNTQIIGGKRIRIKKISSNAAQKYDKKRPVTGWVIVKRVLFPAQSAHSIFLRTTPFKTDKQTKKEIWLKHKVPEEEFNAVTVNICNTILQDDVALFKCLSRARSTVFAFADNIEKLFKNARHPELFLIGGDKNTIIENIENSVSRVLQMGATNPNINWVVDCIHNAYKLNGLTDDQFQNHPHTVEFIKELILCSAQNAQEEYWNEETAANKRNDKLRDRQSKEERLAKIKAENRALRLRVAQEQKKEKLLNDQATDQQKKIAKGRKALNYGDKYGSIMGRLKMRYDKRHDAASFRKHSAALPGIMKKLGALKYTQKLQQIVICEDVLKGLIVPEDHHVELVWKFTSSGPCDTIIPFVPCTFSPAVKMESNAVQPSILKQESVDLPDSDWIPSDRLPFGVPGLRAEHKRRSSVALDMIQIKLAEPHEQQCSNPKHKPLLLPPVMDPPIVKQPGFSPEKTLPMIAPGLEFDLPENFENDEAEYRHLYMDRPENDEAEFDMNIDICELAQTPKKPSPGRRKRKLSIASESHPIKKQRRMSVMKNGYSDKCHLKWGVDQVAEWVGNMGPAFSYCVELLRTNGIDGDILNDCTAADLAEIEGLKKVHGKVLLKKFKNM